MTNVAERRLHFDLRLYSGSLLERQGQVGELIMKLNVRAHALTIHLFERVFCSGFFVKFVYMTGTTIHNSSSHPVKHLVLDMSDCYTWSFPEFLPFCQHLYDFSTFKDFDISRG